MSILAPSTRATQVNNACACGGSFNQYRDGGKVILKCIACGRLAPQKVTDEMRKRSVDSRKEAESGDWWDKSGKPPSKIAQEGQDATNGEKEPSERSDENPPADTTQASPTGVQTEPKKQKPRKSE